MWQVYKQAASQPQCAEQFMCSINQREKKSKQGRTRWNDEFYSATSYIPSVAISAHTLHNLTQSLPRQAVVSGASLAAGWTLSHASREVYWSLYNVWTGTCLSRNNWPVMFRLWWPGPRVQTVWLATPVLETLASSLRGSSLISQLMWSCDGWQLCVNLPVCILCAQ